MKQRTLGLDTRLSVTFSPTMTLELYMQPFFAAAHYYDFKEYVAPRTDVTATYGRDRGTITATRDTTGRIASYTIDPDGTGPAAAVHRFRNPRLQRAVVARERGVPMGVPAGISAVRRVDAVAAR